MCLICFLFLCCLLGTLLWLPDVSQTFLLAKIWTLHHSDSILNQAQGADFWDQVTTTCSSKVRPKTELYWFVFCFSEEARPLYTGNHRKVDERISFIFAEQNSIWGAYRSYRVWPPCASLMFSKPEKRRICVGFKTKHLKQRLVLPIQRFLLNWRNLPEWWIHHERKKGIKAVKKQIKVRFNVIGAKGLWLKVVVRPLRLLSYSPSTKLLWWFVWL